MPRFPKKQAQITALVIQQEKTELEYYIIAVNKSGEGEQSNMVMVVL